MSGHEAAVAAVLAEHEERAYGVCACGWLPERVSKRGGPEHRAHLADVITEQLRKAWQQSAQVSRERGWLTAMASNPYRADREATP